MTEPSPSKQSDLTAYAEAHPESCQLLPSGRLRFTLTGMEFPSTASTQLLSSYENGRAMRRARNRKAMNDFELGEHGRYIVDHRVRDPKFFYWCALTRVTVPKIPHKIKTHVAGKRFQTAFKAAEKKRLAQEAVQQDRWERRLKHRAQKVKDVEKDSADMDVDPNGGGDDDDDEVAKDDVLDGIDMTDDEASLADGKDDSKEEESKASSDDSESDDDKSTANVPKRKPALAKTPIRAKKFATKKRARDGKARLPKKEKRDVQRRKISA